MVCLASKCGGFQHTSEKTAEPAAVLGPVGAAVFPIPAFLSTCSSCQRVWAPMTPLSAHKASSSFSVRGGRVCAWSAVLKRKSKGGFRMTQTGASFVMASFFFVLLKYS